MQEGGGGNRAIPGCSVHQVYYQCPDGVAMGPVSDQLLTVAQGHSAAVLLLITSHFGHSGAAVTYRKYKGGKRFFSKNINKKFKLALFSPLSRSTQNNFLFKGGLTAKKEGCND